MSATAAESPPEIQYVKTYFVAGAVRRGSFSREPGISDPPTAGWARAFLIPGKKTSTVFYPPTLSAYTVANRALEVAGAKPVELTGELIDCLADIIDRRWELCCKLTIPGDFDVAALVLNRLGKPVPTHVRASAVEDGEAKQRGGKEADEERRRYVSPSSRRGGVLRFFMPEGNPTTRPIREAMVELDLTRSGVLSHLFTLNRDHGIGYHLAADCATVVVPEGWDPFEAPARAQPAPGEAKDGSQPQPDAAAAPARAPRGSRGKATDASRLCTIPEGSKRLLVAEHFARGWSTLSECEAATGVGARSIQSHLHDIHSYHGIGHDVDGDRYLLRPPEGFVLKGPRTERKRREK